jgi:hypothetical protein
MKRVSKMSVAEYRALARKMERRYGAHIAWDDIPGRRVRGRPRSGTKREPLEGHLLKMTHGDWIALQRKAKRQRASVSEFIRALARA